MEMEGNEQTLIEKVRQALKGLRYGTVELVVHEGKLVRIERMEKIRINTTWEEDPTGSTGGPLNLNRS